VNEFSVDEKRHDAFASKRIITMNYMISDSRGADLAA